MGLAVAGLALGNIGMLAPVAESAGKRLVLGLGFFQLFASFLMACSAKGPRRGQGILYLQRMMGGMTTEAVAGHLAFGMGFMAIRTVGDLTMHLVAESTGLLRMGTRKICKILSRPLMAGKTGFLDIPGKV